MSSSEISALSAIDDLPYPSTQCLPYLGLLFLLALLLLLALLGRGLRDGCGFRYNQYHQSTISPSTVILIYSNLHGEMAVAVTGGSEGGGTTGAAAAAVAAGTTGGGVIDPASSFTG